MSLDRFPLVDCEVGHCAVQKTQSRSLHLWRHNETPNKAHRWARPRLTQSARSLARPARRQSDRSLDASAQAPRWGREFPQGGLSFATCLSDVAPVGARSVRAPLGMLASPLDRIADRNPEHPLPRAVQLFVIAPHKRHQIGNCISLKHHKRQHRRCPIEHSEQADRWAFQLVQF
jgi:hypothetical protein